MTDLFRFKNYVPAPSLDLFWQVTMLLSQALQGNSRTAVVATHQSQKGTFIAAHFTRVNFLRLSPIQSAFEDSMFFPASFQSKDALKDFVMM